MTMPCAGRPPADHALKRHACMREQPEPQKVHPRQHARTAVGHRVHEIDVIGVTTHIRDVADETRLERLVGLIGFRTDRNSVADLISGRWMMKFAPGCQ